MNRLILLSLAVLISCSHVRAQSSTASPAATEIIQQSQSQKAVDSVTTAPIPEPDVRGSITIPSGTPIEVESAYTVNSIDVRAGELLSFRVLVPITVNGVVAIETGALVTARVSLARRGGHWGKAGRLSWMMVDVIAVDNTRIPLAPETSVRDPEWLVVKTKGKNIEKRGGEGSVKGTGHEGEIATKTIIAAAIFPPLAPLALLHGFKRGENAVLPEGKRYVVVVKGDSSVKPRQ